MLNKMQQGGGENSHNIQAGRDVHNHYGITATDAYEICRNVVKQELAVYFGESLKTAEERFEIIANKVIDRIAAEKPQLLSRFKEPAIQMAVNETYKKYIESGDEELGDNLTQMLVDRLESESRDTSQFVIDDARVTLPKMSKANLAFLAFHVFKLLNIPLNGRDQYIEVIRKLKPIINNAISISALDIEYLKQSSVAFGTPIIQTTKSAADCILNTYLYYFAEGISNEDFNRLLSKHQISNDSDKLCVFSIIDTFSDGRIGVKFSNERRMQDFFKTHNAPKVEAFFQEFISLLRTPDIEDVKKFHSSVDEIWNNAFVVLDTQNIMALSIMPVGVYMGSLYLGRELGKKIPQDIFYE